MSSLPHMRVDLTLVTCQVHSSMRGMTYASEIWCIFPSSRGVGGFDE